MLLDGDSALQEQWTGQVRARWAARRAHAAETGASDGAWLDGDAAEAIACDAAMAPIVTGDINVDALEDLVRLCVELDAQRRDGGRDAAWAAIEQAVIGKPHIFYCTQDNPLTCGDTPKLVHTILGGLTRENVLMPQTPLSLPPHEYGCTARECGIRASSDCKPAPAMAITAVDALVSEWFLARYGTGEVMRKVYDPGTGHAAQIAELEATRTRLHEDRQAGLYDDADDAEWYRTECVGSGRKSRR